MDDYYPKCISNVDIRLFLVTVKELERKQYDFIRNKISLNGHSLLMNLQHKRSLKMICKYLKLKIIKLFDLNF